MEEYAWMELLCLCLLVDTTGYYMLSKMGKSIPFQRMFSRVKRHYGLNTPPPSSAEPGYKPEQQPDYGEDGDVRDSACGGFGCSGSNGGFGGGGRFRGDYFLFTYFVCRHFNANKLFGHPP